MQLIFFLGLAVVAVAAAVGVVLSRNAVYSALALLLNFAVLAVMYFTLNAQFLGVVQIIVYAGAIVVLFLFVIMLIGSQLAPDAAVASSRRAARVLAVAAGAMLLLSVGYFAWLGLTARTGGGVAGSGSVQAIGELLFTEYTLPFEMASVLLLVAMIGAVVLARQPRRKV
jgi:NADH-quinone oxidoreductase subunit J